MQKLSIYSLLVVAITLLGLNVLLVWNKPVIAAAQGKKWNQVTSAFHNTDKQATLLKNGYEPFAAAISLNNQEVIYYRK